MSTLPLLWCLVIALWLRVLPGHPVKDLIGLVFILFGLGLTVCQLLPARWSFWTRCITAIGASVLVLVAGLAVLHTWT